MQEASPDSAAAVFNTAMSFCVAMDRLQRTLNFGLDRAGTIALTAPLITISALSIELLLKTVHAIEFGKVPRGHDLHNLFRNLPQSRQIRIRKAWKAHLPNKAKEFSAIEAALGEKLNTQIDNLLMQSREAFERYRYGFETVEGDMPDFLIMSLPKVLVDCIIEMRPEFAVWHPRPPGTMGVEFEASDKSARNAGTETSAKG